MEPPDRRFGPGKGSARTSPLLLPVFNIESDCTEYSEFNDDVQDIFKPFKHGMHPFSFYFVLKPSDDKLMMYERVECFNAVLRSSDGDKYT